jgi:predicted transcriptional regulator YdeE
MIALETGLDVKSWKYKLERVAKGYVRVTVHSDDIDEIVKMWNEIHSKLQESGESVERVE